MHSTAAPGYSSEPARTPTTPRVYLWSSGPRHRQQRRDVGGLERVTVGLGQVEPDVDEVDHAAGLGGRVDQVRDLVGAERDGHVGAHVRSRRDGRCPRRPRTVRRPRPRARPRTARPPARRRGAGRAGRRCRRCRRARRPAARPRPRRRPAAGGAQRGHALVVGLARRAAPPRPGAAPGQQRPGVQRVAAVVARTDQQQHPGAVHTAEQVRHRDRQPGRRPLHQRALRQPRHQRGLRRPHLLDRVCLPHPPDAISRERSLVVGASAARGHLWLAGRATTDLSPPLRQPELTSRGTDQDSSTTIAEAMPASWDSERCTCGGAELGGPGGDRAGEREDRAAGLRRVTHLGVVPVAGCRARRAPWPAPPWRRTGRPATAAAAPPRAG